MVKRTRISDEDAALFRSAVAGVERLPDDRRVSTPPRRSPPRPRFTEADERAVMEEMATAEPGPDIETGEEFNWRRNGVQLGVMRKLKRGHYRIERELDLHGLRVAEARVLVGRFLADAAGKGLGCVRIIHGKGRGSAGREPVLKRHVGNWLVRSDKVIAFTTARQADGGTGAVVVLLRRR